MPLEWVSADVRHLWFRNGVVERNLHQEECGRDNLDSQGDAELRSALEVTTAVTHPVGDEESPRDHHLGPAREQSSSVGG